jgi:hypothetical protein
MKNVAAALFVAGLVAVAAGCGGGSKNSSNTQTLGGTTHSTTATVQQTSTGSSGSSFASAKNCQDLAGLAAKVASAVSASSGNGATLLQTESNELQALANAAPSDIKGDFQTFATAFNGFLQALQKAGYKLGSKTPPTAAQVAQLSKAAQAMNTPKLQQAEHHLSAWAKQNCKGVHP